MKQEILKEINPEINKDKKLNETIYDDLSENEKYIVENKLLKQLVETLQDKNELLNKLLTQEKEKNNKNENQAWVTYANVLTQSNIKPKNK